MSQFLGKLSATSQAIFPALLFYRHLQGDLLRTLNWKSVQKHDAMMTTSSSTGGTGLVAGTFDILEWPGTAPTHKANHDPVGCISVGLGGNHSGRKDGGSVVPARERDAHQLFGVEDGPHWWFRNSSRIARAFQCCQNWTTKWQWATSTIREERYPLTDSSSKIAMALGSDQEYSPDSPAHFRRDQLHSR